MTAFEWTATCATITLPVATLDGRVITSDVTAVEVRTEQPAPGLATVQTPTIAIGSITYGAGRVLSFRRSSSR